MGMFFQNWLFCEYQCLPPQNCKVNCFLSFFLETGNKVWAGLEETKRDLWVCIHCCSLWWHKLEQIFSSHSFEINHHQLQALRKLPYADTVRFSTTYGLAVEQGSPSSKQSFQRGKLISCHLFFIHKWIQDHSSYFCWKWKFRLLPILSAV